MKKVMKKDGKTWSLQYCSILANLYIHIFPSFASYSWFSGHSIFRKKVKWVLESQVAVNLIMEKEAIMDCSLQGQTFVVCYAFELVLRGERCMHWLLYISKVGLVFLPPQTTRSVGTGYNHPSWDQMLPREKWGKCNKSDDLSFLMNLLATSYFFLLAGLICL